MQFQILLFFQENFPELCTLFFFSTDVYTCDLLKGHATTSLIVHHFPVTPSG
jgi:hypothetical protein